MNIFQLLLSLRRRSAVSSAAATMATCISTARLQCAGSLGSLAPHSPDTGTWRRHKESSVPQQPARSSVTFKCKYLQSANKQFYVLPLLAKGAGTHLVLGCTSEMLTSSEEQCLGKDRTHKRGGGWEKGKMDNEKITRSFTISLAEFGQCYRVRTKAKMGNTTKGMK